MAWSSVTLIVRTFRSRLGLGIGNHQKHALEFAFAVWNERIADGYASKAAYLEAAERLLHLSTRGAWLAWSEALDSHRQQVLLERVGRLALGFELGRGWRCWREKASALSQATAQLQASLRVFVHGAVARFWVVWVESVRRAQIPRNALKRWTSMELSRGFKSWVMEARTHRTVDGPARAALLCALYRETGGAFRTWAEASARHVALRRAAKRWSDAHRFRAVERLREHAAAESAKQQALFAGEAAVRILRLRLGLGQWAQQHGVVLEALLLRRAAKRFVAIELSKCFCTWAEQAGAQLDALETLTRALGRLRMHEVARGWLQWLDIVCERRAALAALEGAARRLSNFEMLRAWNALVEYAGESREAKGALGAALTRMQQMGLSHAWNEMKEVLGAQIVERHALTRAVRALQNAALRRGWNSLHAATAELKAERHALTRAVGALQNAALRRAWNSLHALTSTLKASGLAMRRVVAVLLLKDLHKAWQQLCHVTSSEVAQLASLRHVVSVLQNKELHKAFLGLAEHASAAIAQHDAMERVLLRLQNQGVHKAFATWRADADHRMGARALLARLVNAAVLRAFSTWGGLSRATAHAQDSAYRVMSRLLQQQLLAGWSTWRLNVTTRMHAIALIRRVVDRGLWQALSRWHEHASAAVSTLASLENVARKLRAQELTRGWLTFTSFVHEYAAAMGALSTAFRTMHGLRTSKAIRHWMSVVQRAQQRAAIHSALQVISSASPRVSPRLPASPRISPHLPPCMSFAHPGHPPGAAGPASPRISPHLPPSMSFAHPGHPPGAAGPRRRQAQARLALLAPRAHGAPPAVLRLPSMGRRLGRARGALGQAAGHAQAGLLAHAQRPPDGRLRDVVRLRQHAPVGAREGARRAAAAAQRGARALPRHVDSVRRAARQCDPRRAEDARGRQVRAATPRCPRGPLFPHSAPPAPRRRFARG